ncbi:MULTISPECIES: hypothetical protein [unclassified Streptomyces]|uniref:hypothetical protein n=1 Tax=unclassified Streptomyces TaxID=2593676 RepID=UPI00116576BB|nr:MULTISPECIES: hypothetical protein [unclassified Streptomyces]NMI63051.1 hypothetical protein [Streptomyces sp. RLA2-12]QDN62009.1 hypothetical protein FNV67_47985 [Streptomyces sp. S1D4-20]QDN72061.1 hypothetical protein FNV66_46835 [Streptomyces sp. S1D4-14]QDN82362.1 hypothetical protein FNV64_48535 [Streptomyces sp. S1A1-7]QDO54518.1 hypothetical protein FNV60_45315 [Streptomyces sp. RLB3-5]
MRTRRLALQREAADCLPTWRGGAGRRTATAVKGGPNQTDPAAFAPAFREIVTRAPARGIRVVGGTITQYGGNGGWTAAREAVQQPVNDVTRYDGIFDAMADFDATVRDSDVPHRIRQAFDSGDHPHFNDAGLQAMADAIDLTSTLTRFFVSVSSAGRDPLGFAFEWTPASRLITTRSVLRTEGRQ